MATQDVCLGGRFPGVRFVMTTVALTASQLTGALFDGDAKVHTRQTARQLLQGKPSQPVCPRRDHTEKLAQRRGVPEDAPAPMEGARQQSWRNPIKKGSPE